jgi:hypothetical protein
MERKLAESHREQKTSRDADRLPGGTIGFDLPSLARSAGIKTMSTHWKIVPCPIHAGKHPFHDHRWIMTADAEVEMADYVPNDWRLSQGSIVCQMRDRDPRDARLIAAAPDLLAACEAVVNDCNAILDGDDMSGMSDQELFSAIKQTLTTAIAKAKP